MARIAQSQPDSEPDARHPSSNTGYVLLGYIVEKAGGKPYQEARYVGGWRETAEIDFSISGGAGAILSTPAT